MTDWSEFMLRWISLNNLICPLKWTITRNEPWNYSGPMDIKLKQHHMHLNAFSQGDYPNSWEGRGGKKNNRMSDRNWESSRAGLVHCYGWTHTYSNMLRVEITVDRHLEYRIIKANHHQIRVIIATFQQRFQQDWLCYTLSLLYIC